MSSGRNGLSFAQGQEDAIILFLLKHIEKGFYVDVGCFHPTNLSNTWLLYQHGWRGICIDPNPGLEWLFPQQRPGDIFEAVAVSRNEGTANFYLGSFGVHSSLKPSALSSGECIEVKVESLQTILQRHNSPAIDVLSIDAEGAEIDILESFDWNQYHPRLVIVEYNSADKINEQLQSTLINKGYNLLFINNWNYIFTSDFAVDAMTLYGEQREGELFSPIHSKISRVGQVEKTLQEWKGRGYVPDPEVSFIIQTHNKSDQVLALLEKLGAVPCSEILVLDDGSNLDHTQRLLAKLSGANHFLLRSNDVYEVITYDRAIYYARGRFIALMQDDDDYPDPNWVNKALKIFADVPDLAILGGRAAITPLPIERVGDGTIGQPCTENNVFRIDNLCAQQVGIDTQFPSEFQFVPTVIRAPMWINRELFLSVLNHIDQSYAPFLVDDCELCCRAWMNGLKVGFYESGVHTGALGEGGMRIWNKNLTWTQTLANFSKFYSNYAGVLKTIQGLARQANEEHFSGERR